MMKRLILFFLFLLTGCDREDAPDIFKTRGAPVVEHVTLDVFNAINVSSNGINVVLTQGDSYTAKIVGWKNMMPKIRIDKDGILVIEETDGLNIFRARNNMTTVHISFADELNSIFFSSNGDIISADIINTPRLSVHCLTASGSVDLKVKANEIHISTNSGNTASVTISGIANSVFVSNLGYSPIYLFDLFALSAEIHQHGVSNTFVNVSESLTAVLYGSGNVYYKGNPTTITPPVRKGRGNLIPY